MDEEATVSNRQADKDKDKEAEKDRSETQSSPWSSDGAMSSFRQWRTLREMKRQRQRQREQQSLPQAFSSNNYYETGLRNSLISANNFEKEDCKWIDSSSLDALKSDSDFASSNQKFVEYWEQSVVNNRLAAAINSGKSDNNSVLYNSLKSKLLFLGSTSQGCASVHERSNSHIYSNSQSIHHSNWDTDGDGYDAASERGRGDLTDGMEDLQTDIEYDGRY